MHTYKSQLISFALFLSLLYVVVPTHAHAYIDPGSGSIIVQALIALVVGSLFYIKLIWRKFSGIFSKKKDSEDTAPTSLDDEQK